MTAERREETLRSDLLRCARVRAVLRKSNRLPLLVGVMAAGYACFAAVLLFEVQGSRAFAYFGFWVCFPWLLVVYRNWTQLWLNRLSAGELPVVLLAVDRFTYLIFLSLAWFPDRSLFHLLAEAWSVHALVLLCIWSRVFGASASQRSTLRLLGLFFFSGFAALIYQVAWQRKLFTLFGTHTESVTVIVAVFMLGLGFGALLGGRLSARRGNLPVTFMILECIIGSYGVASLFLVDWVAAVVAGADRNTWVLLGISCAVFAIPTLCMGATLPILVSHFNSVYRQVARSLSLLYAANTLGSALAALATVTLLFGWLGLSRTVLAAALCNFLVGIGVWRWFRGTPGVAAEPRAPDARAAPNMRPPAPALLLSFFSGYFALSMEILWFRYLSFSAAAAAPVFGYLLFAYLGGLGVGALRAQQQGWRAGLERVGHWLLVTAVVFYFAFPVSAYFLVGNEELLDVLDWRLLGVALTAFFAGGIFPSLATALGAGTGSNAGAGVALLYGANIAGAFLGPCVTAFVLLELFSLEQNVALLSGLGALVAGLVLAALRVRPGAGACVAGAALAVGLVFFKPLYETVLWSTQFRTPDGPFIRVVQNRHGIITVDAAGNVMGGGAYDGGFNVDPGAGNNRIYRAYLVAALHSAPRQVLEIGFSSGSWAWVLSRYSPVQQLDIVEINPGYLEIAELFTPAGEVLADPKTTMYFDDGRRWLRHHSERRYDLILMNTTYHWRAHVGNLLSREFFMLAKSRLQPGGVLYLNTTDSRDVLATGLSVFRFAVMVANFAAFSDTEFDIDREQLKQNLLRFRDADGSVYFTGRQAAVLQGLLSAHSRFAAPVGKPRGSHVITDDNMRTEF